MLKKASEFFQTFEIICQNVRIFAKSGHTGKVTYRYRGLRRPKLLKVFDDKPEAVLFCKPNAIN